MLCSVCVPQLGLPEGPLKCCFFFFLFILFWPYCGCLVLSIHSEVKQSNGRFHINVHTAFYLTIYTLQSCQAYIFDIFPSFLSIYGSTLLFILVFTDIADLQFLVSVLLWLTSAAQFDKLKTFTHCSISFIYLFLSLHIRQLQLWLNATEPCRTHFSHFLCNRLSATAWMKRLFLGHEILCQRIQSMGNVCAHNKLCLYLKAMLSVIGLSRSQVCFCLFASGCWHCILEDTFFKSLYNFFIYFVLKLIRHCTFILSELTAVIKALLSYDVEPHNFWSPHLFVEY